MAKKKVLYVITKSNWGGAQRYVFDLATHLPQSEFNVAVAFGQPGRLAEELNKAGIRTFPIASLQRDVSLSTDIQSFFELYHLFKKEKPDIVHLNSSKAGGVGALAARCSGVSKIIFTVHGWPFWEQRNFAARTLIYIASWFTALLCTKIIVISDYDLRVAYTMPFVSHKVTRIYNGVAPLQLSSGEKIRAAFPAGVRITGTIGELNKNKNQMSLIEQARNKSDMYVAIVGEGELRNVLEEKIKKYGLESRVKLLGFILQNEALKGFDELALPSIKEGLPYVLLDAKMAGVPIVANRVGGVGEILDAKDMSEFSLEQMVQKTATLYRS